MIVETTKYIFGGSCIARETGGKTLFVPFALPGERLEVEVIREKKDYCEGRILDVLSASPHRVVPRCEYFSLCGGCDLQMIESAEQHRLRAESATELMVRSRLTLDFPIEFVSGSDWHYRNRFQFHIYNKKVGFVGRKSRNVIHIRDCPIACEEMRKYLKTSPVLDDNYTRHGAKRLHAFAYGEELWLEGRDREVRLSLLGHTFAFLPESFFQSNVEMLKQLATILQEHVGDVERLLDFYSGVGTFSTFFADKASEVHMVEWNRRSLEVAKINIEKVCKTSTENKCFFHAISSEKWSALKASRQFYDVAIVDPPRNGIDKVSLAWFCEKHVERILYVSCDVATFARDSARLIEDGGYKMEKCYFLDFYPQTHHIEVLGIFNL